MRLIDANELLKPVGSYERVKYTHEYGDVVTVEDIELMPIIDAEPVRHGHWIFEPKDAIEMMFTRPKCSECGYESADGLHYCSNCGARMDLDEVKE